MQNIQFDSGIRTYRINGEGILRFNPGDPNVYARFLEAVEKLKEAEKELTEQAETAQDAQIVELVAKADRKMKEILNWVFGADNDFGQILKGVNLLAVADNGESVITNLFAALEPVLIAGAKRCAGDLAAKAKADQA